MSESETVEVVFLKRDINEAFSYELLPEDRPDGGVLGYPVVVPLGPNLTVGLVVDVSTTTNGDSDLKPVRDVLTSFDPLPADLVDLGKWVASYYLAPTNAVFRSIFPPRYLPEPSTAWKLNGEIDENGPPVAITEILRDSSRVKLDELKESGFRISEINEVMEELCSEGVAKETLELSPPEVKPRKYNFVKLLKPEESIKLEDFSPKQVELIQHLDEHGNQFQKDLPESLRRTDLLRRLEENDVIERTERVERRVPLPDSNNPDEIPDFELTDEQEATRASVEESMDKNRFRAHLVHGVTGSGKTEVYFRLARKALSNDKTILVLVPEITLAAFMISRFRNRFGDDLALLHSGLSQGERLDEWQRVQRGEARVVLGVQSAVFAPLEDPGLIVVDEEHDSSYKSGQTPRYHARDVAIYRARQNDIPVVLGSATPSLESYANALRDRYQLHEMKTRPLEGELPETKVTDLRGKDDLLTPTLLKETGAALERNHKAIWFYNRRGMSNFLLCSECGETLKCQQCDVSMTLHSKPEQLRCHYCGFNREAPEVCQNCGADELEPVGSGTQQLAEDAGEHFPGADIIRMDRDTVTKKQARYEKLQQFDQPGARLLIGTQMVTKGLDFEDVDFVGVVLADTGLQFPDFRSGERTFQQLVQVCGRAGRKKADAEVHIQTYNPGHYAILNGKNTDYEGFVSSELQARKELTYPPFGRLINVIGRSKAESDVSRSLNSILRSMPDQDDVEWLGPAPCGLSYIKGNHRWHLMARGTFSSSWKAKLRKAVREHQENIRITIDVDPMDVM
ncbi:MAG: primosomal protein N' [bacterium]